ncbi:MAG: hypothetical protein C5B59_00480 [Bacteroidetes bacterium]|nr:MAG: hypothetical protein C5B59_00480 [Bacteroidota bacterium]
MSDVNMRVAENLLQQKVALEESRRNYRVVLEFERKQKLADIRARVRNDYPGLSPERRAFINDYVFSHPDRSLIFSGHGGLGKSFLAEAVGDIASANCRTVLRTSGQQWEADIRRNAAAEFSEKEVIRISGYALRRSRPVVVIFDEITRIRQTPFMIDQLQDLLDALKDGGHQLIATTNLAKSDFMKWCGGSLYWRLTQKNESQHGGLGAVWIAFEEKKNTSASAEISQKVGSCEA